LDASWPGEWPGEYPPDPVFEPPTDGGGGTTFAEVALPNPPAELRDVPAVLAEETDGGGGTTSCVPKSFPMMLLTKDPLAACVGGGGTTVDDADWSRPLSRRGNSRASADGGGASRQRAAAVSQRATLQNEL